MSYHFGDITAGLFNWVGEKLIDPLLGNSRTMQYQDKINDKNIQLTKETNEQNIAFQREVNAQQEQLQREQWAREDNAAQRRAVDLEAAGLNKNLAAGSAASSTLSTRLSSAQAQAPQASAGSYKAGSIMDIFSIMNTFQSMKNSVKQLANDTAVAKSEVALNNANAAKAEAEAANYNARTPWVDADMSSTIDFRMAQINLYNVESEVKANQAVADLRYTNTLVDSILASDRRAAQLFTFQVKEAQNRISNIYSSTQLNYANINKVSQEIAESIAKTNYLNKEAENIVADTVGKIIINDINKYNFDFSVDNNIRTTDNSSVTPIGREESAKDRKAGHTDTVIRSTSDISAIIISGLAGGLIAGGANMLRQKFHDWTHPHHHVGF